MLSDPLFILAALASLSVLVILGLGISNFARSGDDARKRSNKFMRYRLIAQFVAVILILAFIYVRRQQGG